MYDYYLSLFIDEVNYQNFISCTHGTWLSGGVYHWLSCCCDITYRCQGYWIVLDRMDIHQKLPMKTRWQVDPMLVCRWSTICDAGPTSYHHCFNASAIQGSPGTYQLRADIVNPITFPANSTQLSNAGLMLAHRLRRWSNIKTTLDERLVFFKAVILCLYDIPKYMGSALKHIVWRESGGVGAFMAALIDFYWFFSTGRNQFIF